MKNASKVIMLLAITFGINLFKGSIAQNAYRPIVPVRIQIGSSPFGTNLSKLKGKGVVIPTYQSTNEIDVIVNGRRMTASYSSCATTDCNTLLLTALGLPMHIVIDFGRGLAGNLATLWH